MLGCSSVVLQAEKVKQTNSVSRKPASINGSCFSKITQFFHRNIDVQSVNSELVEVKEEYFRVLSELRDLQGLHSFNTRVTRKRDEVRKVRAKIQKLEKKLSRSGHGYKTTQMEYSYIGEDANLALDSFFKDKAIYYFSDLEREKFKVKISKDGRFEWADSSRVDTYIDEQGHSGMGLFVMDNKGDIYLFVNYREKYKGEGYVRHSSFLSGLPVAAAGELLIENGSLQIVTRKSGHYTPSKSMNNQLLEELEKKGIDLNSIEVKKGY